MSTLLQFPGGDVDVSLFRTDGPARARTTLTLSASTRALSHRLDRLAAQDARLRWCEKPKRGRR